MLTHKPCRSRLKSIIMLRLVYVCTFYIFLLCPAAAQPTLTLQSQQPSTGEPYPILFMQVGSFDPGSDGAAQTWDFSSFDVSSAFELLYQTLEPKDGLANERFPNADFVWFFEAFGAYNYFSIGEDRFDQIGTVSGTAEGGVNILQIFRKPETTLQFPATYQDKYNYTSEVESYIGNSDVPQVSFERQGSVEFDGYGRLITPNGIEYENALRMKVMISSDLVQGLVETQYVWMIPGSFYPVMLYNTDNDPEGSAFIYYAKNKPEDNGTGTTPIFEKEQEIDYGLRLIGNPVTDQLRLTGTERSSSQLRLWISDASGRPVLTPKLAASIDIRQLAAGTYYLIAQGARGTQNLPFIKIK